MAFDIIVHSFQSERLSKKIKLNMVKPTALMLVRITSTSPEFLKS